MRYLSILLLIYSDCARLLGSYLALTRDFQADRQYYAGLMVFIVVMAMFHWFDQNRVDAVCIIPNHDEEEDENGGKRKDTC